MNKLIVQARGGLCNRLRVLISASYLAERYGRELVLCWRPSDACGARFADLFTNAMTETEALPEHPPAHTGSSPAVLERAIASPEPVVCVSECHWLVADVEKRKSVPHFLALRPIEAVTQAVNAVAARFRGRAIGVHVRRGDFGEHLSSCHNLQLPPLERYFAYLDNWRRTIFLATDGGEEVVQRFRDRYGDRLVIHPQRGQGRSSPQAIQEALVDVYLLQRCQAVVGTRFSSFSRLAWCIRGTPFAKVTEREVGLMAKLKFSSRIMLSRMRPI